MALGVGLLRTGLCVLNEVEMHSLLSGYI